MGIVNQRSNILPLSLLDKVLLHVLVLLLFETLQMQPECFGAVVCSVNLSDSNLVLKHAGSFANRGRGSCSEHFYLHCYLCGLLLSLRDTKIWSFLLSLFEKVSNVNAVTELLTNTSKSTISSTESSNLFTGAFWPSVYPCFYISYV